MPQSYDDWTKSRKAAAAAETARCLDEWALMAATEAQKLVGHPQWDNYIKVLQGRIAQEHEVEQACVRKLVHPGTLLYEEIVAIKLRIAASQAAIAALEWAQAWVKEQAATLNPVPSTSP